MHTDLSPHLHTPKCNELIDALQNCHKENRFLKFLAVCNSFDSAVVKCLKEERIARAKGNRIKAYEKHARIKRLIQESSTNSQE